MDGRDRITFVRYNYVYELDKSGIQVGDRACVHDGLCFDSLVLHLL